MRITRERAFHERDFRALQWLRIPDSQHRKFEKQSKSLQRLREETQQVKAEGPITWQFNAHHVVR